MYFSRVRLRPELLQSSQLNRVLQGNVYGIHRLLYDLFRTDERNFIFREEIARAQLGHAKAVRGEPVYYLVSTEKPNVDNNPLFIVDVKSYQPQLEQGQILTYDCRVNPVVTKYGKKHDVVMDAQLVFLKSAIQHFKLENQLPENPHKSDYITQLLAHEHQAINEYLTEQLQNDLAYAEQLEQVTTTREKLEWAIKARIDQALVTWFARQGEQRPNRYSGGFQLTEDGRGIKKFQAAGYQWHAIPEKGKRAGFSSVDLTGELQITDLEAFKYTLFNGLGRSKAFGCGLLMIRRV